MNICRAFSRNINNLFIRDVFCATILPSRNTFIVKRKYPPPLSKLNAKRPRILKARHFVYETVEDTDLTEPPDLKVVLTTFVDGIGDVGDVITLMPEYARDHLLLPKKAVYATPENIQKYSDIKKTRPERPMFSSIHAGVTVRTLSKYVIPVFMNPRVSWTIKANHIQIAFRKEGFWVPVDAIEVPGVIDGPDPLKEAKDFAVFITINNTEKIPVRCRLFHIQAGLEAAELANEFYLDKAEPILNEQKELLENMPMP
ncbi:39S ribosomal protein L9, mitochondrial, partial [Stegodyphus mimosarum]